MFENLEIRICLKFKVQRSNSSNLIICYYFDCVFDRRPFFKRVEWPNRAII